MEQNYKFWYFYLFLITFNNKRTSSSHYPYCFSWHCKRAKRAVFWSGSQWRAHPLPTITPVLIREVAAQAMEPPVVLSWNPDVWHPAPRSSCFRTCRSPVPGWWSQGHHHRCPQAHSIGGSRGPWIWHAWVTGITGRNPGGWRDQLWLGDGLDLLGSQCWWSRQEPQRCNKVRIELIQSMGQSAVPEVVETPFTGSAPPRGGTRGREGRQIRATRATFCLLLLVTPEAAQLCPHRAARTHGAGKTGTCVPLLIWSHPTHQESVLTNKN